MKNLVLASLLFLTTNTLWASEISCLGELEDGTTLNWCQAQEDEKFVTCEEAAVFGLESYFSMKFIDAQNVKVDQVLIKDAEYIVGYGIGPFEILYTKKVTVSQNPEFCFAVQID